MTSRTGLLILVLPGYTLRSFGHGGPPTFYFGQGFGQLPDTLDWARPIAVTGQIGYQIPTTSMSQGGEPPCVVQPEPSLDLIACASATQTPSRGWIERAHSNAW
jgi:hypothetical protein